MSIVSRFLCVLSMLAVGACGSVSAVTDFVLPHDPSWERWAAHQPYSNLRVNHSVWGEILAEYREIEDGEVRFGYRDMSAADRARLAGYVEALEGVPVSGLTRAEQHAYWVNLYNAVTVQVVLTHYPIESIRDIEFGGSFVPSFLVDDGPWGEELVVVEGQPLSLDNIEHRILRPLFRDARTAYVLNRAAVGSPDLMAEPLTAARLDDQLNAAARGFVNADRAVQVDGNRAGVSSIYTWFREDFGGSSDAVLVHLRSYAEPELLAELEGVTRVRDQGFDWALNDTF